MIRAVDAVASLDAVDGSAHFERMLIDQAIGGAGWDELLGLVRGRTGRHCRFVDRHGVVLSATDGGGGLAAADARRALAEPHVAVRSSDGWRARAAPAAAGGRVAGILLTAEPASPRQLAVADAAVTALLIEAVRREAGAAARYGTGDAVIAALRRATVHDFGELVHAAAGFGLDLTRPGSGARLRYHGTHQRTWATAVSWLEQPVERDASTAWLVVTDEAHVVRVRDRLELTVGVGTVDAACGPPVERIEQFAGSFAEADLLLRIAHSRGDRDLSFGRAGLLQLLLAVPDERLGAYVDRHLGPILDRPELLVTLRSWLTASGSRQVVSEQLHLHRNSVGYRVGQLKALLGVDPLRPQNAAVLQAALTAQELLRQRAGAHPQ